MLISERDRLVATLAEYGVHFLIGSDGIPSALAQISPIDLLSSLSAHRDPRLRMALTSVFLLHPDWASQVPDVVGKLGHSALIELQARYMAAVYLQRMWHTRLGYYLGDFQPLPDLFSAELGLPSPDERFGKTGLLALAEWHRDRSMFPFNRLASYEKSLELLMEQLRIEARERDFARAG